MEKSLTLTEEEIEERTVHKVEQTLPSRLRKVVASGRVDRRQICRTLGCEEYVLIDMQSEICRDRFGRFPDKTGVEILDNYVWAQIWECAA